MRGAHRDRHDPRGGMRWTRQRRAGPGVAGRKPGRWMRASSRGRVRTPEAREGPRCPADDHAARCGPGRRFTPPASPWRAGPSRAIPAHRLAPWGRATPFPHYGAAGAEVPSTVVTQGPDTGGFREASRKNHRARNAGCLRCFRGDELVRLFSLRMRLRTHRASGVPRALLPRARASPKARTWKHAAGARGRAPLQLCPDRGRCLTFASVPAQLPAARGPAWPGRDDGRCAVTAPSVRLPVSRRRCSASAVHRRAGTVAKAARKDSPQMPPLERPRLSGAAWPAAPRPGHGGSGCAAASP